MTLMSAKGHVLLMYLPRVPVSIEKCGTEEEVDIGREGAKLGLHLTSVPHSWPCLIIFVPWVKNLVCILPDKGIALHKQTDLYNQ